MLLSGRNIYFAIVVGLIAQAIVLALIQLNSKAGTGLEDVSVSGWYYQLGFLANFLLTVVSVYCFFEYKSRFPKAINVCYVLLLILISVVTVRDIGQFAKSPTLFYSPKGLGTWINFGLLYFIAEDTYAKKIFNLFHLFCYVFIVFNLAQIASLGSVSNRFETQDAIRDTAVFFNMGLSIFLFRCFRQHQNTAHCKIWLHGIDCHIYACNIFEKLCSNCANLYHC